MLYVERCWVLEYSFSNDLFYKLLRQGKRVVPRLRELSATGNQEEKFTQPRDHFFVQPSKYVADVSLNNKIRKCLQSWAYEAITYDYEGTH